MRPQIVLALLASAAFSPAAFAQAPTPVPVQQALTEREAEQVARPYKDATGTSVIRIPDVALSLTGGKGEKKVQGRLGVAVGPVTLDGAVEGVLDEGNPDTDLATLDGLANAATFDVGLSYLHWEPEADAAGQRTICLEYQRSQAKDLAAATELPGGKPLPCALTMLPKESFLEQFMNATTAARRAEVCRQYALSILRPPDAFACDAANLPTVSFAERWEALVDWSIPFTVGGRWTIGRSKFKWADTATGDFMSEGETPWQVAFGANVLLPRRFVFGVEYRRQSDYEQQPKRQVCQPIASSAGATTCRELSFGRYTPEKRHIASFIARKWLGPVAADLRYSFDFENDVSSVEIPVYFLAAEGKGLTGGIAAGWSSEDDAERQGWSVRAFIGDVLDLWPNW